MSKEVVLLTEDPIVVLLASMELDPRGMKAMAKWVESRRPKCLPEGYEEPRDLFPHDLHEVTEGRDDLGALVEERRRLSGNELLVELAGRKCYDSFGAAAGQKTNSTYIANTQKGNHPHSSILYHAKMTFFIAGVSRRVSHELIRNYVGADRDQEGNPSQESTRFTHHYGHFVVPPKDLGNPAEIEHFRKEMQDAHDGYNGYIDRQEAAFFKETGKQAKGLDRKRIFESAANRLHMAAETSFVWTCNPASFAKMAGERGDEHADLEFQRLIRVWKRLVLAEQPNLFPNLAR